MQLEQALLPWVENVPEGQALQPGPSDLMAQVTVRSTVPKFSLGRLLPTLIELSPMLTRFPMPSWPNPFHPQHFIVLSVRMAHVEESYALMLMANNPLPMSRRSMAAYLAEVLARPNCPLLPAPQHWISAVESSQQVCFDPAVICTTVTDP